MLRAGGSSSVGTNETPILFGATEIAEQAGADEKSVGTSDCAAEGTTVGSEDGEVTGQHDGVSVGAPLRVAIGRPDGHAVGFVEKLVGRSGVESDEGQSLGTLDGCIKSMMLGLVDGLDDDGADGSM